MNDTCLDSGALIILNGQCEICIDCEEGPCVIDGDEGFFEDPRRV